MNKKTRLVLVAVLLVALVTTLLAACTLDDSTTTTDADKLYTAYSAVVSAKGYKPVSKTEFEEILTAATKDGGTITSVNATLETANGTEKWILTFVLGDGTTKTAEHAANKADSPDPDPNPTPDPDPTPNPTGNDGSSVEKAYSVSEAVAVVKQLASGAHSDTKLYVRGYITSEPQYFSNHKSYNFYMGDVASDSSNSFMAYSAQISSGSIKQGDEIVIYGYLIHFVKNGSPVYEIGYASGLDNPQIVLVNNGTTPTPAPGGDPENDGKTADTAYTVADALIVGNKLANNAYSSGQVYLKGTIIWAVGSTVEDGETYTYMYIADTIPSDSDNEFAAYVYVDYYDMSDFTELAIGDEVVLYGYLMHIDDATYGNYISMTYYTVNEDAGEYIYPVLISVNGNSKPAPEPDPSEHNFPNYFTYGKCQDEGCHVIGRKAADSTFKNNFKYTLTETDYNKYVGYYNWMVANVNNASTDAEEFYNKMSALIDGLNHVYEQNDIASVLYNVSGDSTDYDTSTTWYYDLLNKYVDIIVKANSSTNTAIKNDLSKKVDSEDIRYALGEGTGDASKIQEEIDNILSQYNKEITLESPNTTTIAGLYEQLVNKNNQLAVLYGYDNYMTYAYKNVYNRNYTPTQTKAMSAFVKQYIVPLYTSINAKFETAYNALDGNDATDADINLYKGLMFDSLFTKTTSKYFDEVKDAIDLISNYFKYLDSSNDVKFYNAVEDLFKTGNYFVGQVEGAFTYYMPQVGNTILYFDNTDYGEGYYHCYSNSFTFVHEFGHYYENVRNLTKSGERPLSFDFCETQSQGNEMMFLAWLDSNTTASKGYNAVKYSQLANMLQTVLNATAIDEFEQAVYTGSYEGYTTLNANNYQDLYDTICTKYGINDEENGNTYWMGVCFDNAAYYISYAMSALPSIEIYAKAVDKDGGLDVARTAYLTLFTNASTDYNTVLAAAGLHNAFEEALYTELTNAIK